MCLCACRIAYGCDDDRVRVVKSGDESGAAILIGSHMDFINSIAFGMQQTDFNLISTVSGN
jgi:hypothetical protein